MFTSNTIFSSADARGAPRALVLGARKEGLWIYACGERR